VCAFDSKFQSWRPLKAFCSVKELDCSGSASGAVSLLEQLSSRSLAALQEAF
jgi:hypothetical protein